MSWGSVEYTRFHSFRWTNLSFQPHPEKYSEPHVHPSLHPRIQYTNRYNIPHNINLVSRYRGWMDLSGVTIYPWFKLFWCRQKHSDVFCNTLNVNIYPRSWIFCHYIMYCSIAIKCFISMVNIFCLSHDKYITNITSTPKTKSGCMCSHVSRTMLT